MVFDDWSFAYATLYSSSVRGLCAKNNFVTRLMNTVVVYRRLYMNLNATAAFLHVWTLCLIGTFHTIGEVYMHIYVYSYSTWIHVCVHIHFPMCTWTQANYSLSWSFHCPVSTLHSHFPYSLNFFHFTHHFVICTASFHLYVHYLLSSLTTLISLPYTVTISTALAEISERNMWWVKESREAEGDV